MASVIKELIKKFKEQIEQVDQWTVAYEQYRSASARNKLISHNLIQIMVLHSASDKEVANMSVKKLDQYANEMVTRQANKMNVSNKMLEQVMGLFWLEHFENSKQLMQVQEELELIYEEDSMMEEDITEV